VRDRPLAQLLGVARQRLVTLLRLRGGLQLCVLALEVGPRPAPLSRRDTRQLDAVGREQLATNQALPGAYREYGGKDRGDVGA